MGIGDEKALEILAEVKAKFGVPVVPHVGDMGQLHQHLVLFNHISLGLPALFLEHIPHLRKYFTHPVQVVEGIYKVPQEEGSSCDLKETKK